VDAEKVRDAWSRIETAAAHRRAYFPSPSEPTTEDFSTMRRIIAAVLPPEEKP
jgi:hypothetical protein